MFKSMWSYTFKTLFRKRTFTLASITSIVLFIVSIVSIFIVGTSVWQSYKSYLHELYGSYVGVVQVTDEQMIEEIQKSPDVEKASNIISYGTLQMPEHTLDEMFSLAYMEESVLSAANITVAEGRLPTKAGEILIEKSVLQKLKGGTGINDIYTFRIESGGETVNRDYRVVGIVNDYSAYQSMRVETAALWPSLIMTYSDDKLSPQEAYCVVSTKNNTTAVLESLSEKYSSQVFVSQQFSKESFVGNVGGSTQAILIIGAISVFVIALICLSVFSSLSAVVVEDQILSLKFIGATSSSVMLFGILNLIMLYLIALPIGFLFGIACGYGLASYIVAGFVDFYIFNVSLSGVAVGVLIALVLLLITRVIKILRIMNKKPLSEPKREKLYLRAGRSFSGGSLFYKWSLVSLLKNKRAYFGIALSMSVCYFVLFMGGMYNQTIAKEYDVDFKDHFTIKYTDGEFFSSLFIPANPYAGVAQGDADAVLNNDEIDSFSYIKQLPVLVDTNKDKQAIAGVNLQSVRASSGSDTEEYEAELKEYGITPHGELYTSLLDACDSGLISKLLGSRNVQVATQPVAFDEAKDVVLVHRRGVSLPFNVGENIRLIQVITKDGYETKPENRKLLDLNLRIGAIAEIDESDYLYDKFRGRSLALVCSDTVLRNAGVTLNYNYLYLNLKDPSEYSETQKAVNHFKQLYLEIKVVSERENEAEKHRLLHTLNLVVTVLSVFIFIVCLFNIINILSMKYLRDKKLWGTLRAMGISRTRVLLHHSGEMLAVMLGSVLMNACFLAIASQRIRRDITIFNPALLFGYVVGTLLVCLLTAPIVLSVFRKSIISQIEYLG